MGSEPSFLYAQKYLFHEGKKEFVGKNIKDGMS
jgi:hypothetical protein